MPNSLKSARHGVLCLLRLLQQGLFCYKLHQPALRTWARCALPSFPCRHAAGTCTGRQVSRREWEREAGFRVPDEGL